MCLPDAGAKPSFAHMPINGPDTSADLSDGTIDAVRNATGGVLMLIMIEEGGGGIEGFGSPRELKLS